jgi:glycosyltransferase involved in cell wall biosynthesis
MPKISLVVPIYRTEKFLVKVIDSLLDQDLTDFEIIAVADGYSSKATMIMRSFDDERIKFFTIPHGGACKARNEGAKLATGEYIAFFSSDFQAIPGMLRTWIRAFEEHPEVDFIYGGYSFPDRNVYPSEEFDPYQLETYNYIDGGFPLKRKIWEKYPWDEKIKSLNDWDFWLRIVRAGHKGYFMKDYFSYIAEYPRIGGLSYDSHDNWLERVKQVRANNNIPIREICVSSLGAPFHAKKVARMLNADFIQMPSSKPHEYKMIYLLGFYPQMIDKHAMVFVNAPSNCKKVIHWLGSDIGGMGDISFRNLKGISELLNKDMTVMFAESEAKQKELAEMGVRTEVLPLLRDIDNFKPTPFPKDFAVGIYMPGVNSQNYYPVLMENIAKNMPDVKFYFYGDRNIIEKQIRKNIEVTGWVDIQEIIGKCSVLLRFVIHDGLPTAPMEFLMSNRFVLTNTEMPYVEKLDGNEDTEGVRKQIIEKIRDFKRRIKKGEQVDPKAREYYRDYLNPAKIIDRIYQIIK